MALTASPCIQVTYKSHACHDRSGIFLRRTLDHDGWDRHVVPIDRTERHVRLPSPQSKIDYSISELNATQEKQKQNKEQCSSGDVLLLFALR